MFESCPSLESINIPESVTRIGDSSFRYCSSLKNIDIPDSVTEIGYAGFEYCGQIQSVKLSENLLKIGNSAFSGCTGLSSIIIPNSECVIYDSSSTICSGKKADSTYYFNGIIYGVPDSSAQIYAEKYGYTFKNINDLAPFSLGDVNMDRVVDASDASEILSIYAVLSTTGKSDVKETEEQLELADVDVDGFIDASDASYVLGYYAYISTFSSDSPISIEEFVGKTKA